MWQPQFPLNNPKYERFAQARARGRTLIQAGKYAGYPARTHSSLSRIGKREDVRRRIQYLQDFKLKKDRLREEVRKRAIETAFETGETTEDWIKREIADLIECARAKGDDRMRIRALILMGSITGSIKKTLPGRPRKTDVENENMRDEPPAVDVEPIEIDELFDMTEGALSLDEDGTD
jgi:phage terminase small subunit